MINTPLKTGRFSRHATWLELFYDLIYVVVIAKLSHLITEPHGGHLTLQQYAMFAALFVPVWWAWTGHMMFQNRFDPEDTPQRILTLLQMLAACFMAIFIPEAFAEGANAFALSYIAIRVLLVIMYWRVHRLDGDHTNITGLFIIGFSGGILLWIASIFAPDSWKYWLWGAGLTVDMVTPWIGRKRLAEASVHASHLPERLGLLTIIVLGESVVSIVDGIEGSAANGITMIAILSGFLLLGAIWWLYFHSLEASLMGAGYTNGQLAIYGHLPVYLGLATVAAGVRFGISGDIPPVETAALLCGGLLLFLMPLQIIHWSRLDGDRARQFIVTNVALDIAVLGIAVFSLWISNVWVLGLTAFIYTAYVLYETPKYADGPGDSASA